MKILGNRRKHRVVKTGTMIVLILFLALFISVNAWSVSGGEHEEGDEKGWVTTDTYRVLSFVVLVVALFLLLRKPASQALNSRIKEIEDQLNGLETQKKDAEEALARYKEQLSSLDDEADKVVDEYIKQGNEVKARILDAAASAAEKLEEQARRNIEREFKAAAIAMQEEIAEKALAKAEEKILRNMNADDRNQLIDDYLKKVVVR